MIRIGTRGSKLALRQAALVQEALWEIDSYLETELVILHTRGDTIQDRPIYEIGEKGVFASEFEQALLCGQIDLAVHSAKDLPMKLAKGLTICATLKRADVRDVLVVPKGGRTPIPRGEVYHSCKSAGMETGALQGQRDWQKQSSLFRIGSGSRRRQILAAMAWENVICEQIRGNIDTRLGKLKAGAYDGILLAKAGLDRLGIGHEQETEFDVYPLCADLFLPAACQGIIAVEAVEDSKAAKVCRKISDLETELCYLIEREVLTQLSADCSQAAAAWCRTQEEQNRQTDCMVKQQGAESESPIEQLCLVPESPIEQLCLVPESPIEQACLVSECVTDRLLLDVMYAENRVSLSCPATVEKGRQLARQAAQMVKGQKS